LQCVKIFSNFTLTTGAGHAIVKHLIKAHGWEMQIESTAGKGTMVRIVTA
jgi:signal transduction histidine kinase